MLQRQNDFLALLLKNYIFIMAMGLHHFDPPIKKLSRLSNIYLTEFFLWNQTYIFCGAENVARSRIASTVLSLLMLVYNTRNRPRFTGIETACMPVRGSCIEVFLIWIIIFIDNKFTAFTVLDCITILLLFQIYLAATVANCATAVAFTSNVLCTIPVR